MYLEKVQKRKTHDKSLEWQGNQLRGHPAGQLPVMAKDIKKMTTVGEIATQYTIFKEISSRKSIKKQKSNNDKKRKKKKKKTQFVSVCLYVNRLIISKNTVVRGKSADWSAERRAMGWLPVQLWFFVIERSRVVLEARRRGVDWTFVAQTQRRLLFCTESQTRVTKFEWEQQQKRKTKKEEDERKQTLLADGVREALRGSRWLIFHCRNFSRSFRLCRKTLPIPVAIFDSSASLFYPSHER